LNIAEKQWIRVEEVYKKIKRVYTLWECAGEAGATDNNVSQAGEYSLFQPLVDHTLYLLPDLFDVLLDLFRMRQVVLV